VSALKGTVQTNRFATMNRTFQDFYEWRGGASYSLQFFIVASRGSVIFHLSLLLLFRSVWLSSFAS